MMTDYTSITAEMGHESSRFKESWPPVTAQKFPHDAKNL